MRAYIRLSSFILAVILLSETIGCKSESIDGDQAVHEWVNLQSDSLLQLLKKFDSSVRQHKDVAELKAAFTASRYQYKILEPIIEYYFQGLTKRINGPALPDIKTDDNQVFPPHGFQLIEQILWSNYDAQFADSVSNEIHCLQADLRFVISNFKEQNLLPKHMRELVQDQIIRIGTLGITGFDAPMSKLSLHEAIYALKGLESLLKCYIKAEKSAKPLQLDTLHKSIKYLENHLDFDGFDRLHFLKNHLAPLSVVLKDSPFTATANDSMFARAFSGTLHDLLNGKGFNPDYYEPYAVSKTNADKVKLGELLFADKALSKKQNTSCASCHQKELHFTDGLTKAANFVHGGTLLRNTPTLYYAALQAAQFYDMRATSLEDQIHQVMQNGDEFNLSSDLAARRLSKKTEYKLLIKQAFQKDSLSGFEVRNALAAYIRSLNPFKSKFDAYMNGNESFLNNSEKLGFNLFTGKAKCASCHFVPLFNGTMPPMFTKSESEIIGVPEKSIWAKAKIDRDNGRYQLNKLEELRYAFKTPTVRNAAVTSPYMHNGVYQTLTEVIEFYHKGGGVGLGIELRYQTLPFDSLTLNSTEKTALIDFLKVLTDQ